MSGSTLEARFASQVATTDIPPPVREHMAVPGRRWRVDFAWPLYRIAVEIEGGAWTGGRHTRGAGFVADCEKYNEISLAGWTLIRATGQHVKNGAALAWLIRAFKDARFCIDGIAP